MTLSTLPGRYTGSKKLTASLVLLMLMTLVLLCSPIYVAQAAPPSQAGVEFFETRIRPVLVQHCYKCHSDQTKAPKGELRLDTRATSRRGGESGHAVVPNDVDESLIVSALRYETFEMPPSGALDESIVADFEAWIRMGAPDPRDESAPAESRPQIDLQRGRDYWAFQPLRTGSPPDLQDNWIDGDIDRFLLTSQRQAGISPVSDADPASLLRRVYFDLIGLPPTLEESEAFVQDSSADAYRQVVDDLLESPHFGERWGRHWLDVVRYAESTGRTRNYPYPFAWRYRDYVIDSLNADTPYDRFITEQLAGDLLPAESAQQRDRQKIATGFLAVGARDLNEGNVAVYRMDVVGEQIDVTSRAIMAITIGCARCHDHKFDPIPTTDYYALAGIFRSSDLRNGYNNRRRNKQLADPGLYLKLADVNNSADLTDETTEEVSYRQAVVAEENLGRRIQESKQRVARIRKQVRRQSTRKGGNKAKNSKALRERLRVAQQQFRKLRNQVGNNAPRGKPPRQIRGPYAMGVQDAERIGDCPVHRGGDVKQLGDRIPRGFLRVIPLDNSPTFSKSHSGRLELAQWLTRPDHPLTSRVIVNRVWHHLFGRGIVTTVDNFGAMGSQPSHPELLDYLSRQFVNEGWSIKRLIRTMVLSHAYRLSSQFDERNFEIDGDNRLVWRMPRRRLEAEAIRDAILTVSGQLAQDRPNGSPIQDLPVAPLRQRALRKTDLAKFNYRSVYLPIVRSRVPDYLTIFDFPEPSDVKGARDVTTVATQALFMMNSPFVQLHSRLTAERLLNSAGRPRDIVREAYLLTLGREPTETQMRRAVDYCDETLRNGQQRPRAARLLAVTDLVQALIGSAEFRYH